MDLFDYMREQNKETSGPLASRMRPTTLDEVIVRLKPISSAPSSFTGHRVPERLLWQRS